MPRSTPRRPPLLAVAALCLGALLLAGCGGSDKQAEKTPEQVLQQAKRHFDNSRSVHLVLSTGSTPSSGNGVLGATGTVTHAPAYDGDVKVVLGGLTATVPVTSVDGKVYAKLPLQTKFSVIDPAEYGAPDPADFADPRTGLSALMTKMTGLEKGDRKRSGEQILTTYTGSVPGEAVKRVIPSAEAGSTYRTRIGVDEKGYARTVRVTGRFFAGESNTTYDVRFSDYGRDVEITPPAA